MLRECLLFAITAHFTLGVCCPWRLRLKRLESSYSWFKEYIYWVQRHHLHPTLIPLLWLPDGGRLLFSHAPYRCDGLSTEYSVLSALCRKLQPTHTCTQQQHKAPLPWPASLRRCFVLSTLFNRTHNSSRVVSLHSPQRCIPSVVWAASSVDTELVK